MKKRLSAIGILLVMFLFALNSNACGSGWTSVNNSINGRDIPREELYQRKSNINVYVKSKGPALQTVELKP